MAQTRAKIFLIRCASAVEFFRASFAPLRLRGENSIFALMKKTISIFTLVVITQFMTGCAQDSGEKDYVVTITTKYGDMVAILYDETPKHKQNFIKLAKEHYFDGTLFHRVIKEFMIQGGDPDSKTVKPGGHLGNGGPGYSIPAEINPKFFHEKGALSAARLSDDVNPTKSSSGSQFYVVQGHKALPYEIEQIKIDQRKLGAGLQQFLANPANKSVKDSLVQLRNSGDADGFQEKVFSLIPRIEKATGTKVTREVPPEIVKIYTEVGGAPHLDGEYTVFGKVIKGLQVIDKIAALPGDESDRPIEDVSMVVSVEEIPKTKITKLYGYQYPAK